MNGVNGLITPETVSLYFFTGENRGNGDCREAGGGGERLEGRALFSLFPHVKSGTDLG